MDEVGLLEFTPAISANVAIVVPGDYVSRAAVRATLLHYAALHS